MTRVEKVDRDDPDPRIIAEAARVIRSGGLVAFPTETVYGLGADASSDVAVRGIYEAKGRPSFNPLIVHAADVEQARTCCSAWPIEAERLAARFWPGPLTIVLPRADWVPDSVTAGLGTVGIRVPEPIVARALIRAAGRPLAAPSANRSTGISPSEARHVLKDLDGRIAMVLDAGPTRVGIESTVLDLSGDVPRILRPGMIGADALREVLGRVEIGPPAREGAFTSPGQMDLHYAPRTPTLLSRSGPPEGNLSKFAAVFLGVHPPVESEFGRVVSLHEPVEAAERLYAVLHELDEEGWEALILVEPPDLPEWHAIRDRIRRAGRAITSPPSGPAPA